MLADVYESFQQICLSKELYGLDPSWYVTLPSLTMSAMLKYTNVEIELLTDLEQIKFVQKAIRGVRKNL